MRSLIVVFSYHHNNTEKVANTIAKVLGAEVKTPQQVRPEELKEYDLVGFGSGIYSEQLHPYIIELAEKLPQASGKKAFVFSTNGAPAWAFRAKGYASPNLDLFRKNHLTIKEKLQSKGYTIVDEFSCAGFNTNVFLKYFGGLNKGRPNAEDLGRAREFARGLIRKS
jgi:flavodoxin